MKLVALFYTRSMDATGNTLSDTNLLLRYCSLFTLTAGIRNFICVVLTCVKYIQFEQENRIFDVCNLAHRGFRKVRLRYSTGFEKL